MCQGAPSTAQRSYSRADTCAADELELELVAVERQELAVKVLVRELRREHHVVVDAERRRGGRVVDCYY